MLNSIAKLRTDRSRLLAATAIGLALFAPTAGRAQDASCKAAQDAVGAVAQKYKADFDGYAKEGEDIKGDSVTFSGDVTWADVEIVFDLPSTTIRDQKMVLSVPQTTLKQQDIIFDTPSVKMVRVKIGQHPETTCHDTWIEVGPLKTKGAPACDISWHDNYIDVPTTFMERQKIVMGVPEFRWDTTDVIMGIPEFKMERQRWVVGLPQFKVTSIAINEQKIEDRSKALTAKIRDTQAQEKSEMGDRMHALFACHRGVIAASRDKVSQQFSSGLAQLDSAIQMLRGQGADPSKVAGSDGKTVDLVARRDELLKARDKAFADFDKAIASIDDAEHKAIDQLKA
jgi:hypothetical protein